MKTIDTTTPIPEIQILLESLNWISNEQLLSTEIPGAGNMNVVMRVITDQRTFILKQSRPFVQKYPTLPAPLDRIDTENHFYKAVKGPKLDQYLPKILAYSPEHYLMMMEDLGQCEDLTSIYANRDMPDSLVENLVQIAQHIHQKEVPANYPKNMELRKLNHQHIFVLPFQENNGFQLDDVQQGLQALSLPYKKDEELKANVAKLGELYLSAGNHLIHGDYYPGSWMHVADKLYVMDVEFSYIGFKEFDLGVMVAHLMLATANYSYLAKVCSAYSDSFDQKLVQQLAGIEILRRLIGLGQLPLERSLEEKDILLKLAREMVIA